MKHRTTGLTPGLISDAVDDTIARLDGIEGILRAIRESDMEAELLKDAIGGAEELARLAAFILRPHQSA